MSDEPGFRAELRETVDAEALVLRLRARVKELEVRNEELGSDLRRLRTGLSCLKCEEWLTECERHKHPFVALRELEAARGDTG